MAVNYNDWLPLPIWAKSSVPAASSVALVPFHLTDLCRLYWMAKTCSWSININWDYTFTDAADDYVVNDVGSLSGSGSFQNLLKPGDRVAFNPQGPFIWNAGASSLANFYGTFAQSLTGLVTSGLRTLSDGSEPYSYPFAHSLYFGFLSPLEPDYYPSGVGPFHVVARDSDGFYAMPRLWSGYQALGGGGPYPRLTLCTADLANTTIDSGLFKQKAPIAPLTIKVDGSATSVPLFGCSEYTSDAFTLTIASCTGTLEFDFNDFWT